MQCSLFQLRKPNSQTEWLEEIVICDPSSGAEARSLTRRCSHVLNKLQQDAMYDVKLAAVNKHGESEESQLFSFFVTGLKRGPGQAGKGEKTRRKGAQRPGELNMFSWLGYYELLHLQRHVNI